MSQENARTFYNLLVNDSAVFQTLYADTGSAAEFLTKAVAAAKDRGLSFEPAELAQVMRDQLAAEKEGRLSDGALEHVTGGAGGETYALMQGLAQQIINGLATP